MKKLWIALVMLMLLLAGCKDVHKEVTISQATIQKMVEKKFPIEKQASPAKIKLFAPKVFFQGNSMGLDLQYRASVLFGEIGGSIAFTCKPVYRPETACFYMSDFVMTRFTVNNVVSLENDTITGLISTIMNSAFKDHPLYKLNQDDYKQNLAQMMLKQVSVRGDDLVLLMAF
ncbi:MAG TPA: DUF1439 domain-containing protein [Deltaproteobacteria bacterium]|mgnify:CR=1 FL=1|nr:DUF1439 domain-containing protein [Deltaproteobacteria bacterium]